MWSTIATWQFSMEAVEEAARILQEGGTAEDAAEQGIRVVESDENVNSVGRGGLLNAEGNLELDAAFMNGSTLRVGAVGAVQHFEHPVSIARAVMEKSRHNFLVGEGAESFAESLGMERASRNRLVTAAAALEHEKNLKNRKPAGHDTIGLLALDEKGTIVSATSTSGWSMKWPGRVGDTPLIGSGFYALSGVGAAAATGVGEDIMRTCISLRIVELMEQGLGPGEAAARAVVTATKAIQDRGIPCRNIAVIALNVQGETGGACNHRGFVYTCAGSSAAPREFAVEPVILGEAVHES